MWCLGVLFLLHSLVLTVACFSSYPFAQIERETQRLRISQLWRDVQFCLLPPHEDSRIVRTTRYPRMGGVHGRRQNFWLSAIAPEDFVGQCDFGRSLLSVKTIEMTKFRTRCREFIDRVAVPVVESASAKSVVSKGLYSFCPELTLEGDDNAAFELFSQQCRVLEKCKTVASDEVKAALDEYKSYGIEKRRQHCRLER